VTAEAQHILNRDQKIIAECEETGEPYFVFRAKDILALFPLKEYERVVELYGPDDHEFAESVATRIAEFKTWQHGNVSKVKYPD
jgi:hypothetical protein